MFKSFTAIDAVNRFFLIINNMLHDNENYYFDVLPMCK